MAIIAVPSVSSESYKLSDPHPPAVTGGTSFADYLSGIELQDPHSAHRRQARSDRPTGPSGGSPENGRPVSPRAADHPEKGAVDARSADRPQAKTENVTDRKPDADRGATASIETKKPLDNTDMELSVAAERAERSAETAEETARAESPKHALSPVGDSPVFERASRIDAGRDAGRDADDAVTRVGLEGAGKGESDPGPGPEGVGNHEAVDEAHEAFLQVERETKPIAPDAHDVAAVAEPATQSAKRGSAKDTAGTASVFSTIETTPGGGPKGSRGRRAGGAKSERIAVADRSAKAPHPASFDEQRDTARVLQIDVHLDPEEDAPQSGGGVDLAADTATSERPVSDVNTLLPRMENAPATQRSAGVQNATRALARRLDGDLGSSIVRYARIMLKETGSAEIRLIIRPPELGRVRINMQMENGYIAGRILVDNENVRETLGQNLAALERAFEEAGLEVGTFEVSTGDRRGEAASDGDTHRKAGRGPARKGAGSFADSVEPVAVNDYSHRTINLVV